jgi:acylphosphatase
MQKRVTLKIFGKVQGVFFRDLSSMEAKKLNLTGWVRNEPESMVKIVAEGEDKDLSRMIDWCKYGPENAEVEKVDVRWEKPAGEFDGFAIL